MPVFSYHLAKVSPLQSLRAFAQRPTRANTDGLIHAEPMAAMELGAPIVSTQRMQLGKLALFAAWEDEAALDAFLNQQALGKVLRSGWHLRLQFIRRWGDFPEFADLPEEAEEHPPQDPVVAVTLARLRLPEVRRFIRWGKPVEEQVRDHPATTLALATMRPLRTFSTFSIWKSQQAMTDMVHGRSSGDNAKRHSQAMSERKRRDFHHHFITLRFKALSEQGKWDGSSNYVPPNN
ncbi:MAG: hypothetical protein R3242_08525 [Akkermansiaceae bacterium]|nr:hypothetical protein [Akkermansiaceae bacterium]